MERSGLSIELHFIQAKHKLLSNQIFKVRKIMTVLYTNMYHLLTNIWVYDTCYYNMTIFTIWVTNGKGTNAF